MISQNEGPEKSGPLLLQSNKQNLYNKYKWNFSEKERLAMKSTITITIFIISTSLTMCAMDQQTKNNSWGSSFSNWLKSTWIAKQMQAVSHKKTSAQEAEEKWSQIYQKKETSSEIPIYYAESSAQKFKRILTESNNPLLAHFKNHPEQFLFGASSSSYQYEGGLDGKNESGKYRNANAQFYSEQKPPLPLAGDAIDFWDRYEGDIQQMKEELGINAFRLSIAWDRVEPEQGKYDMDAIRRYVNIILTLKEHNIEPIVVLHHYTIPTWFEDIGGFETLENIDHFVAFCTKMYDALYEYVTYWSTFNAIEGYAFKGYYRLDGPPGKVKSMQLTQQVMANMLEAHVRFYQAVKNQDSGLYYEKLQENNNIPQPRIGLQKNIVLLDSATATITNPIKQDISAAISVIGEGAQNKGFFDFFTTGTFNVYTPRQVYHHNALAPQSIDWIGLNIYSNMLMRFSTSLAEFDEDKATENKTYRDYPEGIYRAAEIIRDRIAGPSKLNLPIIITENGIATKDDASGEAKRTRFFQRTLFTIRMLIKEGYPIIGYTPWASHDNYEWPTQAQKDPFTSRRYGFFHVDFDKNLQRTLKSGALYYRDFIKKYFEKSSPAKQAIEAWKE